MSAIRVTDLTKTFGRRPALAGLSLEIGEGEMVALIGASGSGKSTLMRIVAGLELGDQGSRVEILGRPMQQNGMLGSRARELRREIGVVFQQFNLVARLSVMTNVLTGLLGRIPRWRGTLGLFRKAEKDLARQALRRVGIEATLWQRASTLSGGQQQRAAIARTLVQRSRILLADEPIASLDPSSARRVMDTIAEINRLDGITAVVSLHQVEYARRYCRRTIALRDGRIVFDGPSQALSNAFLRELYGTASEELILPDGPAEPARAERPTDRIAAPPAVLAST
ncbi:phosphonates import ATP-binding protein PhnC 2 [Aureimonas endophytica]|uniref:Phosphonates import ATP-binding protein PhnC 2 n=1 Tax=Aureimonas endophytica TaxID=2027858 RepID=A0A917E2Z1_9HYPH|nr:phosphonate ABC transporter ATP-binding protein [Aureimonas endophytica]GGD97742.1 phosphonates import ATP-binding protein PhnC 2 [Aureimonas endophytica]